MADLKVALQIIADAGNALNGLKAVSGQGKQLASDLRAALGKIDAFDALQREAVKVGTALEAARERVRSLGQELAGQDTISKQAAQGYANAVRQLQQLQAQATRTRAALADQAAMFKAAGIDTSQLTAARQRIQAALNLGNARIALHLDLPADAQAKIAALKADFVTLRQSGTASFADIARAGQNLRDRIAQVEAGSNGLRQRFAALHGTVLDLVKTWAAFAAIGSVESFTRSLVDANVEAQRIDFTLQQVFGADAGAQFQFVQQQAERLGLNLKDVAEGYASLAASAQGTGVSTQALRTIFVGMNEAATVLHTSAADVAGTFTQLAQGISLGKLQMQDIRAIAQHLPGTMTILTEAAKRLGTTLEDSLAHGGLDAKAMLEAIGDVMHERFGQQAVEASQSLNAELNRLHSTLFELQTSSGGFADTFADAFRQLNRTLADPQIQASFRALVQTVADAADAIMQHLEPIVRILGALAAGGMAAKVGGGIGGLVGSFVGPEGTAAGAVLGATIGRGVGALVGGTAGALAPELLASGAPGVTPSVGTPAQQLANTTAQLDALKSSYQALQAAMSSGQSTDLAGDTQMLATMQGQIKALSQQKVTIRVQILNDDLTAAKDQLQSLQTRINAGLEARNLPAAAAQEQALVNRIAALAKQRDALQPPDATASAATDPEGQRGGTQAAVAQASAALTVLRDQLQARKQVLDDALAHQRISYQSYYDAIATMQRQGLTAQVAVIRAQLADDNAKIKEAQAQVAAGQGSGDAVAAAEAHRVQTLAQLTVLQRQLGDVGSDTQRQLAAANQKLNDQLDGVKLKLLQLSDPVAAAAAQIARQYKALIAQLKTDGRDADLKLVMKLELDEQTKAQTSAIKSQASAIQSRVRQQVQTLANQVRIGTLTGAQAQTAQAGDQQAAARELDALITKAQALHTAAGDTLVADLKRMREAIVSLREPVNQLVTDVAGGLQNSFQQFFSTVLSGTASLKSALLGFLQSFASAINQVASKMLAQQTMNALLGFAGFGVGENGQVVRKGAGSGAGAADALLPAAAGMLKSDGKGGVEALSTEGPKLLGKIGDGLKSLLSGGKSILSDVGGALKSLFSGSGASSLISTVGSALKSLFSALGGSGGSGLGSLIGTGVKAIGSYFAAADGGHVTGPGTATSDSIPAMLSDGEYVLNARTVQRVGVGMLDALNGGSLPRVRRFATGGLVGAATSRGLSVSGHASTSLSVPVNVTVHSDGDDDPQQAQRQGRLLGDALRQAVLGEINRQKRPGGLLHQQTVTTFG